MSTKTEKICLTTCSDEVQDPKRLMELIGENTEIFVNNVPLIIYAARYNLYSVVEKLIKLGEDVNRNDGDALIYAVESENLDIVRLLLNNNINVNSKRNYSLCEAVRRENIEMVDILL